MRIVWKGFRRFLVGTLLLFLGLAAFSFHRMRQIAAVQDSLERDWEITFNVDEVPRILPPKIGRAAQDRIERMVLPERDPPFFGEKTNRTVVWEERFYSLFQGTITNIEIYYPGRLRDDLGSAVGQFRSLKRLVIQDANFSKADWAYVFAGLHRLRNLQELEIGGEQLVDSTLEPLAGQQSLRKVSITTGKIGTECVGTFAQLPNLRELYIEPSAFDDGHEDAELPFAENQKLMRKALPNVLVTFAQDPALMEVK